ncbi:TetR/AcrR family transcriptional regulator [Aeromicrobium sp. Leaf350]|uniref:TetR/AcrR family transcriptional regulator n=1 Tax=Aeromicrobium sp. Leaf350 TaxID=2876565 RepID=UPI001E636212|nr:TetR-like C-terminal domain-containing protein [Aeromicrobium sp. Leaf350]
MPRAGLTPDQLVLVAAALADRDGLDRVTVSSVARQVGVKPASVYAHLDGADDLLRRVTQLALTEMAERAADAVAGRSGRDALEAWAGSFRTYAFAHPGRYAASHRPLGRTEALAGAGPRHTALSATILRGYDVPEHDHPHAVRLLGSTIHGFLDLEAAGSFDHSAPPAADSWPRVVDALDALLRTWPTP